MSLTRLGWTVALTSVVLVGVAYLLGYPRVAVLGVGGLTALVVGTAAVARRPRVTLSREIFPTRVPRGEPAVGMLRITNTSRVAGLRIEAWERFGAQEIAVPVPYLRAGASREIGYPLPTARRGVIEVGPLRWERADVLGLVRWQDAVAGRQLLFVHPRVHEFALGAALRAQRWDSAVSDAAPNGTITFHHLREYVPGDDLRYIHWRSSARLDTLLVRQNIDVALPRTTMLLVTDEAAYPDPAAFEEAVEVAASTLLAAAGQRLPARLVTSAGHMLVGSGGHDDARMFLDFLAGAALSGPASAAGGSALGSAVASLERSEGGGVLVVAAGALDGTGLAMLRRLSARYDQTVVALIGAVAGTDGSGGDAADLAVPVLAVRTAKQFCTRWPELARR
jgi:uncharacterized protein (DUF58 family)